MKEIKERLKEQIKKLTREDLEKRYLDLLFKTVEDKKAARLSGTLGSIISQNKKKKAPSNKKQYQDLLKDKRWLKKREEVFERYGHQCVQCGSTSNLHIHHLRYVNGKKPWEYDVSDLIPLCKKCHTDVHSDKNNMWNPYNNK